MRRSFSMWNLWYFRTYEKVRHRGYGFARRGPLNTTEKLTRRSIERQSISRSERMAYPIAILPTMQD